MSTINLIREQINAAHDYLERTMADVTDEVAHWQPGGTAHPIGSRYAHMAVSEDMMINSLLKGEPPLFVTSWARKTGLEDPQAAFNTTLEWAQSVNVDLEAMRAYAQTVYANTDAYLDGLDDEDLAREVDLSEQGMGKWGLDAFLLGFIYGHIRDIMGEISALKGVQGLQGYPF